MTDNNQRLRTEKIGKLLLQFSIPAIVGMMVNALYNVVDRIYIGWIGPLAMTGIGISMPLMTLMMAFGMLVGIGAAAVVSIRLGQGKLEEAEHILGNAVSMLVILMGSVAILGLIFKTQLLNLFGASAATIGYADPYITIILFGAIFQGLGFGLNNVIRASGSPKTSMYTMLIGAGANIILDPIFIFVFGMGIAGAAWATIISQALSMIWVLKFFNSPKSHLRIKREHLKLDKAVVISIIAIGMSPFAMHVAASVTAILFNNALKNTGGDIAIGAMTVVNAVVIFFVMPLFGINQGVQPIIGFNYGAKAYDRVKEALRLAIIAATGICVFAFLATQIFTTQLVQFFNRDPELIKVASDGMRIFMIMLPIIGFQIVSANYFQAVGKASKAMFLSLLRQVLVLIPMILILPPIFGLKGVWMAGPIADFTASVVTAIFLFIELRHLDDSHEAQSNALDVGSV